MRPYLEGYHFTIINDHQALKWLTALKNPTRRLALWALNLQPYDYEILYRKGALNRVADALSRQLEPPNAENFICTAIAGCTWYDRKMDEARNRPHEAPDFTIIDGKLHRKFWDADDLTEHRPRNEW